MNAQHLARIASDSLSRVDCPFCHGRLHTHHKPDCPAKLSEERRMDELIATLGGGMKRLREAEALTRELNRERQNGDLLSVAEVHAALTRLSPLVCDSDTRKEPQDG